MGETLVSANVLDEPPVLLDTANNAIRLYVEEKAQAIREGKEFSAPITVDEVAAPDDLLAALSASVAAAKK